MITKEFYCDLGNIYNASLADKDFAKEVQEFYDNNPHNNGASFWFVIEDLKNATGSGSEYPLMNEFLKTQGAVVGDQILLRSSW